MAPGLVHSGLNPPRLLYFSHFLPYRFTYVFRWPLKWKYFWIIWSLDELAQSSSFLITQWHEGMGNFWPGRQYKNQFWKGGHTRIWTEISGPRIETFRKRYRELAKSKFIYFPNFAHDLSWAVHGRTRTLFPIWFHFLVPTYSLILILRPRDFNITTHLLYVK